MTALEIVLIVVGGIIVLGVLAAVAWPVALSLIGLAFLGFAGWGVYLFIQWLSTIEIGSLISIMLCNVLPRFDVLKFIC